MSKLQWLKNGVGVNDYTTGVEQVALYLPDDNDSPAHYYGAPVAWDGVSAINENPSGAEPTKIWANDFNYLTLMSKEEYGFGIEAYASPEEFDQCDGMKTLGAGLKVHGQARKKFGLSYFVPRGREGVEPGALVASKVSSGGEVPLGTFHIIYGALASPPSVDNATVNDSPEAQSISWDCQCAPVSNSNFELPAGFTEIVHMEIDTEELSATEYALLIATLQDATDGYLPDPAEFAVLE